LSFGALSLPNWQTWPKLKPATRGKLAAALGVSPEQLRW